MKRNALLALPALALALATAACGAEEGAAAAPDAAPAGSPPAEAPAAEPAATGEVIEVRMVTDGEGSYFEPAEVTARPGDVVRFTLVSGVHNVSFPAAGNAGASSLPAPSPYLQRAGQTYDLTVDMPAGEYAFQCDPHAALGMVGTLNVEE